MNNILEEVCNLEGQPLSLGSIKEIVEAYADGSTLARNIQLPENEKDFNTKFINLHESYILLNSTGTKIRICHNLDEVIKGDHVYILLHGLGGSIESFEPLLRLLDATKNNFITLDLPGFGRSDELDFYPMNKIVGIIHDVVSRYILENQNISIVGHSMGCYFGIKYLQVYSSYYNIEKLILLAPPEPKQGRLSKDSYWTRLLIGAIFRAPWIFDLYRTRFDQSKGLSSSGIKDFFYNNDDSDINNKYRRLWQFSNNVQIKSRSIMGYFKGWEDIDWDSVNSIQLDDIKIRIACGNYDKITPFACSTMMYEKFENFEDKELIKMNNIGHNVCFDDPKQMCAIFYESILQL